MSVNAGRAKLYAALKEMRMCWRKAQDHWKDAIAADFEEQYWSPLESIAVSAISAMDQLEQVILQIRQECAGDGMIDDEQ